MSSLHDTLFAPLGEEYCMFFYYLSVISFVLFAIVVLSSMYLLLTQKKDMQSTIATIMTGSFAYLLVYFQNRLLYSMCSAAL